MKGEWKKSSRCETGQCVEVLDGGTGAVYIRDANANTLRFSAEGWSSFIAGIKAGIFDLP